MNDNTYGHLIDYDPDYDGQGKTRHEEVASSMRVLVLALLASAAFWTGAAYIVWRILN